MGLPDWVFPFAVVLLILGLPIVLATAVAQERLPGPLGHVAADKNGHRIYNRERHPQGTSMSSYSDRNGWRASGGRLRLLALTAAALVASCADRGSNAADGRSAGSASTATAELPEILATVAGEEIRWDDLPVQAREQLVQLENSYRQQRYSLLEGAVEEAVASHMLAAEARRRDLSVAELVAAETDPIPEPTDDEVEAWYAENQARLGGRSLDQLRGQIREHLRATAAEEQGEALDRGLREKYDVEMNVEPFRVSFDNAASPAVGPDDATATLVEFSDFECPFCARFFPTLKRVEQEYGDRVRIVYRQFPLPSIHPNAFKAAEASLCAHEQGEFWPYHDLLFEEQDRLAVRDLKEKAGRLGLNGEEFDRCLDTGRYVEQVQQDMAAGQAAGVTGTPALFVNGVPVTGGAVGYDVVAAALDEELARRER